MAGPDPTANPTPAGKGVGQPTPFGATIRTLKWIKGEELWGLNEDAWSRVSLGYLKRQWTGVDPVVANLFEVNAYTLSLWHPNPPVKTAKDFFALWTNWAAMQSYPYPYINNWNSLVASDQFQFTFFWNNICAWFGWFGDAVPTDAITDAGDLKDSRWRLNASKQEVVVTGAIGSKLTIKFKGSGLMTEIEKDELEKNATRL